MAAELIIIRAHRTLFQISQFLGRCVHQQSLPLFVRIRAHALHKKGHSFSMQLIVKSKLLLVVSFTYVDQSLVAVNVFIYNLLFLQPFSNMYVIEVVAMEIFLREIYFGWVCIETFCFYYVSITVMVLQGVSAQMSIQSSRCCFYVISKDIYY